MSDWRPAIGARVLLRGSHPWAGSTGTVVAHETLGGDPACRVELDNGHQVGVLNTRHLQVIERTL